MSVENPLEEQEKAVPTKQLMNPGQLEQAFKLSNNFVEKAYLNELAKNPAEKVPEKIEQLTFKNNIRLFKICRLVYDKTENTTDKLASVYNTLANMTGSLVMIIDSDGKNTDFYLGVKALSSGNHVNSLKDVLTKSFYGNFPGSQMEVLENDRAEHLIESVLTSQISGNHKVVAAVSNVPSLKGREQDTFVQGLEKLIDAMCGEKFSGIFIADAVDNQVMENIRLGYESLYSQLVPFARYELSMGSNTSHAVTEGDSETFTQTINQSVTMTQSHTSGFSDSQNRSYSESETKSIPAVIGALAGFVFGGPPMAMPGAILGGALFGTKTTGTSEGSAHTTNTSVTNGTSETEGSSNSHSVTQNQSRTLTTGDSRQLNISYENKVVCSLLAKIDQQLERISSSADFGLWNCACYFTAEDNRVAKVAASTFKAIMRGDKSAVEGSFINVWEQNNENLPIIQQYLKKACHPLISTGNYSGLDSPCVTPGSLINGKELTIQMGLPRKSISGLPVIEYAEFGRNVISYGCRDDAQKLNLGCIFHMGRPRETEVQLDLHSLAMHTFVTGSTGSGKSNAVYHLLNELHRRGVNFLVIEPAKGEYKQVFGGREGVQVYGTNPFYTPLLRINPFLFPRGIHVLEHIDRLVEIFNACWPMYAAMPAVLKEGIERIYMAKGWDLTHSTFLSGRPVYPTFEDLLKALPGVINESDYSPEVKSNYTGALVTRVKSLTNGLYGKIFGPVENDNEQLFDKSCIVDISRIGSTETKALIMGLLFMRLHERRMASNDLMNSPLKHITVLEEAHHLLRKVPEGINSEGSNLRVKSVEMITNAIAEMRTYGEGFIIVDQAPNLLDSSVIRNTNTKLLFRLPGRDDREEAGKSACLNEDQINEVSRLITGVAAVYQNNWLQPVLCAVKHYVEREPYVYREEPDKILCSSLLRFLLYHRVAGVSRLDPGLFNIPEIKRWLRKSHLREDNQELLTNNLVAYEQGIFPELWHQKNFALLSDAVSELVKCKHSFIYAKECKDMEEWDTKFRVSLKGSAELQQDENFVNALIQCLLRARAQKEPDFANFYFAWIEYIRKKIGGI